jgi:hypothetical protein
MNNTGINPLQRTRNEVQGKFEGINKTASLTLTCIFDCEIVWFFGVQRHNGSFFGQNPIPKCSLDAEEEVDALFRIINESPPAIDRPMLALDFDGILFHN